jgi:hypothetical protein
MAFGRKYVLQIAIAFFGAQVAAWAGLCLYLRMDHQRRIESTIVVALTDAQPEGIAQAA